VLRPSTHRTSPRMVCGVLSAFVGGIAVPGCVWASDHGKASTPAPEPPGPHSARPAAGPMWVFTRPSQRAHQCFSNEEKPGPERHGKNPRLKQIQEFIAPRRVFDSVGILTAGR